MGSDFVHLHVHSEYSLLDGACKHDALIEEAKRCGMPALAVTDHGNLFGAVEFYQKARKAGIKPILGVEAYVAVGSHTDRRGDSEGPTNHHLVLLCENETGWRNLSYLVSKGFLEGFYYKPRIGKDLLRERDREGRPRSEGLICLSACLKGEVAQNVVEDRYERARAVVDEYVQIFGRDRYFLEVQENGLEKQRVANAGIERLASEFGLGLVATGDVHYLRPEDKKAQDVLVCINTGKTRSDPKRLRIDAALHFKPPEEMARHFPAEVRRRSVEIAERCNVSFDFSKRYLPHYRPETGETPDAFFDRLCAKGLRERYRERADAPEVQARLVEETAVIKTMGFVSYFLIVWDFIDWAKRNGIPVGPGRGSAAGSVVAYALGITDICPLKYDLLFERFLNKERISMPDIDVDFCQERRERVIEYVRAKYGRDAVSQIITFGTMAAKAVVRDVGRVLDIPLKTVDGLAKKIPTTLHIKLKDALEQEPDLKAARAADPQVDELFDIATRLEGVARHASTHAAGVVIGDGPLIERVPLYQDPKTGDIVTQFSMGVLEDYGLLKMDFLGLRTLTVLHFALENINARRARDGQRSIDLRELPMDDLADPTVQRTFEMLRRGDTKGVFQMESTGFRELVLKLQPDRFEDLIALVALYRPGPLQSGIAESFCNRKKGIEPVTYPHASLEETLRETYGVPCYQEQIMRIANRLAGFTLSEADSLRKAMGKKKPEVMAKFKESFLAGAARNGCARETAEAIWQQMEYFCGYAFNKSHSAAYALVSYQTAWLKANHPVEFMAAVLSSEMGNTDKLVEYLEECARLGIEVLPPDITTGDARFSVIEREGKKQVAYGLLAVKGVGDKALEALLSARAKVGGKVRSLYDLATAIEDLKPLNKAVLEALARAGALDALGGEGSPGLRRARLLAAVEPSLAAAAKLQADRLSRQGFLFGADAAAPPPPPPLPEAAALPEAQVLAGEKETLGLYLSSHPLRRYERLFACLGTATTATLAAHAGAEVWIGGLVAGLRPKTDKKGQPMAFVTIEDLAGRVDAIVFASVFATVKSVLAPEAVVFVRATVDSSRDVPSLLVNEAIPVDLAEAQLARQLILHLGPDQVGQATLGRLVDALRAHRGPKPVYLKVRTPAGFEATIRAGQDLTVTPGAPLRAAIADLLGPAAYDIGDRDGPPRAAAPPDDPAAGPDRGVREGRPRSRDEDDGAPPPTPPVDYDEVPELMGVG